MDYLKSAQKIFNWLKKFQVTQEKIEAVCIGGVLHFSLRHPVKGEILIEQGYPDNKFFKSHGIGLAVEKRIGNKILLSVYDYGGIFDPIDKSIPGTHYATTHFALLGALIFSETGDKEILAFIKKAIFFHIKTSPDEYIFDEWGYHWDFQNYAFIETYRLIEKYLTAEERNNYSGQIKKWKENTANHLTNWFAMRTYSSLLRYKIFNKFSDLPRYIYRLFFIGRARLADGCFDDSLGLSRPIQYHVFVLAMLHRIYLIHPNKKIKNWFLSGVDYFINFIDPDGCYNFIGRGQEQIFGYGIGIYVLEAAKSMDNKRAGFYQYWIVRMWNYLNRFKQNNIFPLVLNHRKDSEKFGWYDYHHLTVYEAFLGVWLALSHKIQTDFDQPAEIKPLEKNRQLKYLKPSGLVVFSNEKYYAVFSRGAPEYLSEPGITPIHLWFNKVGLFFSCPGGPYSKFGKINKVKNIDKNIFAPIVKRKYKEAWYLPAFKKDQYIGIVDNLLVMIYDYGPFILKREVKFECDRLVFRDEFEFKVNEVFEEFRYFNFPVICDKYNVVIEDRQKLKFVSGKNCIKMFIEDSDFKYSIFEKGERFKTVKGPAETLFLRKNEFQSEIGEKKFIKFVIS